MNNNNDCCNGGSCSPKSASIISRRDFVKLTSQGLVLTAGLGSLPAMVSSFLIDKEHLIPADKGLSASWIKSLYQRTNPQLFEASKDQLKYIGMPIGGIGCGQLYLGGDGKIWLWDIFKSNYSREKDHNKKLAAMTMNGHYTKPIAQGERYHKNIGVDLEQGFALYVTSGGKTESRLLDINGFENIAFRGEYPIGKVTYTDKSCPVSVKLEAFSPFVPLNVKDSTIPATTLNYTIENTSEEEVMVQLGGWLENKVCPLVETLPGYLRQIEFVKNKQGASLNMTVVEDSDFVGDRPYKVEDQLGNGSMAITLIEQNTLIEGDLSLKPTKILNQLSKTKVTLKPSSIENSDFSKPLIAGLKSKLVKLQPGEKTEVRFIISWYFPDYPGISKGTTMGKINNASTLKRYYANHFNDALQVSNYIIDNKFQVIDTTKLWNEVWYDSTLPHWLLDRAFIPLSSLATQTAHYFNNERFWAWEGVDCCPGTCQHVWNYAQANARIFPKIEQDQRQNIDFDLALKADGESGNRAEHQLTHATDGQAGAIVRLWREHTLSPDLTYLKAIWPKVKLALEYLIKEDLSENGILTGAQHNTLDAAWYGPVAWISSVYCAALAAGEQLALEVGDNLFAEKCSKIYNSGKNKLTQDLFNGEYFINKPNPEIKGINSNIGCEIDQVLGQSWAIQLGLPRVVSKSETISALESLWKYNFAPDAGLYDRLHTVIKGARIYAEEGEAGLLMCTWPKGGDDKAVPGMDERIEDKETWLGPGGYFDECMTGFEYQVAAHMVYEGEAITELQMGNQTEISIEDSLVLKGLAITRAVHDRYAPEKRNPYNEIECSDHYARAMASYGVFLAVCGFKYHGPKGIIKFDPKIAPENFKAPFTTAEGWGTFTQKVDDKVQNAELILKYGKLTMNQLQLVLLNGIGSTNISVKLNGENIGFQRQTIDSELSIILDNTVNFRPEFILTVEMV